MPRKRKTGHNPSPLDLPDNPWAKPETDASEYSWGAGLVPPGLEDAPPRLGGMYKGKAPECDEKISVARPLAGSWPPLKHKQQ